MAHIIENIDVKQWIFFKCYLLLFAHFNFLQKVVIFYIIKLLACLSRLWN